MFWFEQAKKFMLRGYYEVVRIKRLLVNKCLDDLETLSMDPNTFFGSIFGSKQYVKFCMQSNEYVQFYVLREKLANYNTLRYMGSAEHKWNYTKEYLLTRKLTEQT